MRILLYTPAGYVYGQGNRISCTSGNAHRGNCREAVPSMASDVDNQGTTDGGDAGIPFATVSQMSRNARLQDVA